MFNVDLPEEKEQVRALLQSEIQTILERTGAIGIEKLLDLPVMTDPASTALLALLTHCLPAAYQYDQDSYALLTCTMVRLSLEHGNSPLSARAYGSFAALIVSALRRYEEGYRFAKLGVDLAHKLNEPSVLSGRVFPLGDVRVALDEADRRERRPLSAEHPIRAPERRPPARGLQRRAPLLASAVPRHADRRAARGRERDDGAAAADRRRDQHGVRDSARALPRLAPRRSAPRQHARQRRARRDGVHGDHPGARQPIVRVRLVPAARDAALLRRRVRGGVRVRAHGRGSRAVQRGLRHARRAGDVPVARDHGAVRRRRRQAARRLRRRARAQSRAAAAMGERLPRELRPSASARRGGGARGSPARASRRRISTTARSTRRASRAT